ncbi:hypothetical protein [Rhizobium yanglingense]
MLGPSSWVRLLLGITNPRQYGSRELISFIALFGVVNALGALAGPALLGSYMDGRLAAGDAPLTAQSDAHRLAAALAALTTAYLAVILALRIRRKMAELRISAQRQHSRSARGRGRPSWCIE